MEKQYKKNGTGKYNEQMESNKKTKKTTTKKQKNSKTNGPSVGFPEKQRLGLGLGGCANHQPFPENLCAHSSVDAGTETQTEPKLILAHIACEANSRT